jgi:hypothetical protein
MLVRGWFTLCAQTRNERVGALPPGAQRCSIPLVAIAPTRKDFKRREQWFQASASTFRPSMQERVAVPLVLRL